MRWIQSNPFVDPAGRLVNAANTLINGLNDRLTGLSATYAIETSYPSDFTPPFIQADSLGNVTIANHTRYYGDGTSVAVTGDTLATGELNPTTVWVYYDDPRHTGGAVTYAYATSLVIQTGARHVVGKVQIPLVGTQDGTYLMPPGAL